MDMSRTRYHKRSIIARPVRLQGRGLLFALLLMALLGIIYGVLLAKADAEVLSLLSFLTDGFTAVRQSRGFFALFFGSFGSSAVLLLLSFWLGLSIAAQPFLFLLPFFRGLGLGITVGYLASAYGLRGVGFAAVLLLPYAILSLILLLLSCQSGVRMANALLLGIFRSNKVDTAEFKRYLIRCGVLLLLLLPASLLDATLSFLFARFFTL